MMANMIIQLMALISISHACSNFLMENDFCISARTMDLGKALSFGVSTVPIATSLAAKGFPKAKYGFVGFIPVELDIPLQHFVTGGLNTAGVSCDQQTLLHTVYPNATGNQSTDVAIDNFCEFVLGNVANVSHLESLLLSKQVTPHGGSIAGGQHFVVRDAKGQSLVIEFLEGKVVVAIDEKFGVLTNEPPFQWQVENAKHAIWKMHNARPSFTIPGAFYPDERFLRIHLFKSSMPTPKTNQEALMQAVHVLNSITVPPGMQMGTDSSKGEGAGDHTKFAAVYDHLQRIVYWRTETNQNLQRLRLEDAKLQTNNTVGTLSFEKNNLSFFNDASSSIKR
jgi:penicillin V acylase-like amidase (Ntn superfamily)